MHAHGPMSHRFYLPPERWATEPVELDASESHHALHVLRLARGSQVRVFDGCGREALATICETRGGRARLELGQEARRPPLPCQVTLAQAIPKGKTMELIIQKAVELGAAKVAPLISERTIVRLHEKEGRRKAARWRQVAIEACKQCGQNWLPHILEPQVPASFLKTLPPHGLALIGSLQPGARSIKDALAAFLKVRGEPPKNAAILIGPEGDFTPDELQAAISAGCIPVTLGPIVLRTDTAAIYGLSVLAHELFLGA